MDLYQLLSGLKSMELRTTDLWCRSLCCLWYIMAAARCVLCVTLVYFHLCCLNAYYYVALQVDRVFSRLVALYAQAVCQAHTKRMLRAAATALGGLAAYSPSMFVGECSLHLRKQIREHRNRLYLSHINSCLKRRWKRMGPLRLFLQHGLASWQSITEPWIVRSPSMVS